MNRAPKAKYEFWKKRHGDTMECADARQRAYVLSAFANWMRNRPGTLQATSKKTEAGYLITFVGISPAEITQASLSNEGDI